MTATGEFNDAEWQQLRHFPLVVAALISAVDYSTLSEGREYDAFTDFIRKSDSKRRKSLFIAEILDEDVEYDRETFLAQCTSVATAQSGEKPIENALQQARNVAQLVDERLEKRDAKSYKEFVLDVALAVARAHKESALPFASSISTIEDFHIRRLTTALGVYI